MLALLSVVVGLAGGFGAVLFRGLISWCQTAFFAGGTPLDNGLGLWVVAVPAVGGLIVGLLVHFFAREAKGHGVPEVMEAVAIRGGRIRPRVALVKSLASSICIGSGGSAGREGPIVQIGAAIGSSLGQALHLPPGGVKILLACGTTAGIATTFNAPIAAVVFSIELILIEFKTRSFIPLVISSVTGTVISRAVLGKNPAFLIPTYHFKNPYELVFYLALGVIAGLVSVAFIRSLYGMEGLFDRLKTKPYLKPVLGGLLLGVLGLFLPRVFGVGYDSISAVLNEDTLEMGLVMLPVLCFAKLLANSLTLGSGGSGGVFSPSLFIGAMLGGAFGALVHSYYPDITASYGAYALVGMAAVFAGASRGTFTAIIIVFEMTLDYNIILPLMFACVVSDAVSSLLSPETIYTKKLAGRGVTITHDMEVEVLSAMYVRDAMVRDVVTIREDAPVRELVHLIQSTEHMGYPVLDKNGRLAGIITHHDIHESELRGKLDVRAGELMSRSLLITYPDSTLDQAISLMVEGGVSHLPVVDVRDRKRLIGFITKGDIMTAHHRRRMDESRHVRLGWRSLLPEGKRR